MGMYESDTEPYQVAKIQGLDPVKANLTSSSYAGNDGEVFQNSKRAARNIVMEVDLDPVEGQTYGELRQGLYTYFMPKNQVKLRFHTDTGLYLDTLGYVESFDVPIFDKDPQISISIMCYDPDLEDPRIVQIESGTVDDTEVIEIDYPGNVSTGTVVTLNINRELTDFTIYNSDEAGNTLQLDFTGALEDGDTLVISSRRGNKGITLTRTGIQSSYLYGRSAQSNWIELDRGLNNFRIYAAGDPIPYVLEYVVRYGGL
jgi:hypothetical protein